MQVPSWRAGQAVEGFSTAHIAGSKLASRPSCGRFQYCTYCRFQVGEQAKLWKVLVLHILQVPSWRAGQAVEGFSTAHIAGSKLASRRSCGRY